MIHNENFFLITKKFAKEGDAGSQYILGTWYKDGKYEEQDYKKALNWFKKSADQGDTKAQLQLGIMYLNSEGVDQDLVKAYSLLNKLAESGNSEAHYYIALMWDAGLGLIQDKKEAFSQLTKAANKGNAAAIDLLTKKAEQGDIEAQFYLGEMYARDEPIDSYVYQKDYKKSVFWYSKAAEQGHPDAQNKLEEDWAQWSLAETLCEDSNENAALAHFINAAEQGNTNYQIALANRLRDGDGVAQDIISSAKWFEKAADKGVIKAQLSLAWLYEKSNSLKNHKKAFEWYKKATETDDQPRHQHFGTHKGAPVYHLGLCYLNGIGVKQNSKKALECFKKAQNNLAFEQIGLMYRDGLGVTKDIEKACEYLEKAGGLKLGSALYALSQIYQGNTDTYHKHWDCLKKAYDLGDENAIDELSNPVFQKILAMNFLPPFEKYPGEDNYRQAAHWLKKAAEQGNNDAQYELGVLYFEGNGVLKSKKDSAYWIKKAADGRSLDDINDETLLSYNHAAYQAERFWQENELWKYE